MTEQAIAGAAAQIAAPVVAALLEDLHTAASAEITRLEATMPPRIQAAETDIQNWTNELVGAFHGLVARIDSARGNVTAATKPPAVPTPATPPPASSK